MKNFGQSRKSALDLAILNCKLLVTTMHAFLLIGAGGEKIKSEAVKLASKLSAKIFEYPISKIEDVRNLNGLLRLSFDKSTLVFCPNIHEAGEEALNAFLKNLEEPQENIYFALSAPSTRKVLPTIVSRCQIIRVNSRLQLTDSDEEVVRFLEMSEGMRLSYVDKIKDREKAIEFTENMVNFVHRSLHKNGVEYTRGGEDIKTAVKTLSRLKANGNVNLHLSNLAINLN